MKWIVRNKNGVLEFQSIIVCTESQYNKINASVNQQRIVAWCADMHVTTETLLGEQKLSILKEIVKEVNESEARRIDRLHIDFLKFIDKLPEVDSENKKTEKIDEREVDFVNDMLSDILNTEISGAIVVSEIGPIVTSWGRISAKTLTKMCECYLDRYGNKNS